MIETLSAWLQATIETFGPAGIGIATAIESFFTPIPSEVILVAAGTTINDVPTLTLFIISSAIGSWVGTLPYFLIGYKSREFFYKFIDRFGPFLMITVEQVKDIEAKFDQKGGFYVFSGRLIPGVRSLISIPAGITRMNFKAYTTFTLLGSGLWNTMLLTLGFMLKDQYQRVIEVLSYYEKFILVALLIIAGIYLSRIIYLKS